MYSSFLWERISLVANQTQTLKSLSNPLSFFIDKKGYHQRLSCSSSFLKIHKPPPYISQPYISSPMLFLTCCLLYKERIRRDYILSPSDISCTMDHCYSYSSDTWALPSYGSDEEKTINLYRKTDQNNITFNTNGILKEKAKGWLDVGNWF